MAPKAEEIQACADRHDSKNFFAAIKTIYGPPTGGTEPLFNSDRSTFLTEKLQILKRRTDHSRSVLNRPSAIDRLPQVEINADLYLPPSFLETGRALQQLSSGEASSTETTLAEI
ncbi:hypothetical protein SprV_0401598500 [Sparganum proliferum]